MDSDSWLVECQRWLEINNLTQNPDAKIGQIPMWEKSDAVIVKLK